MSRVNKHCAQSSLVWALILASIVLCRFSAAQTQAAPKSADAIALAQRSLTAMGQPAVSGDQVAVVSGTLTQHGPEVTRFPIAIKSKGTSRLRTELTTTQGIRVIVFNNGSGQVQHPNGKIRRLSTESTVSARVGHIPAFSLLAEHQTPATTIKVLPQAVVNGTSMDVLAVGLYSGSTSREAAERAERTQKLIFIDHKTGFVSQIQERNYDQGGSGVYRNVETRYSDYRQAGSIMVPFHQETYANGVLVLELDLDSVSFNVAVDDKEFELK